MTRSGHFSRALATVSAVRIPSFFAGIDAAVTIPWRVFRSPPTIEGMVRKSTPPGSSRRSFTADHDKNAEFTSTWKIVLIRALYYCEEVMAIWAWSCAQASVTTVYHRPPVSLISQFDSLHSPVRQSETSEKLTFTDKKKWPVPDGMRHQPCGHVGHEKDIPRESSSFFTASSQARSTERSGVKTVREVPVVSTSPLLS